MNSSKLTANMSRSSSPLKHSQAIIAGAADVFIRRRRPKMIYAVVLLAVSLMVSSWQPSASPSSRFKWQVNAETTTSHDTGTKAKQTSAHPPVYVDTKYWIKSTEFGERDNWLNQHRPCTLFERIKMNEQSVVSMGSSMDSLGGNQLDANNIYELTLAQNGMLLLEEDPPDDPIQAAFIDYLKAIGDCYDDHLLNQQQSTSSPSSEDTDHLPSGKKHLFEFEPNSDEMSWFNPENWASTPNEYGIEDWFPESHQIPCSEDIVVFGGRQDLLEPILETGERAKTISFKVNFRPSRASLQAAEAAAENKSKNLKNSIDSLRVAKLHIGERQYDQQDFEKLINSEDYGDILFQFNDSMGALRQDSGGYSIGGSPLIIDESSLVRDSSQDICLDEAGCLCGNERAEIMEVICSFNERLNDDDLPCTDPIYSAGYCNKICATSLTISMDPSKFSERFLNSIIEKQMNERDIVSSVLVGARRIDVDKYEILFRHMPNEDEGWSKVGAELDSARGILQQLEIRATKSFYGIKSIKTKSSVQWRRDNRVFIFWFTATLLSLTSVFIIARKPSENDLDSATLSDISGQSWLTNIWDSVRQSRDQGDTNSGSMVSSEIQPTSVGRNSSDMHGSFSNIPLVMLDENDVEDD